MKLSAAKLFALRLTVAQNVPPVVTRPKNDKFVTSTAVLLAGLGMGVSSFSLKQMTKPRH